ncbi:MAG TPA: glycosyltransferase family 4 protein [Niabella sp.]|nr:glycosyltransferase family 4 protein [Niabella sp.]
MGEQLKVALFTDGIWPFVIGGMQKHSYCLVKYLARIGVKVHLYHTLKGKSFEETYQTIFTEEELSNIEIISVVYPSNKYFPGHYLYESYLYSKNLYKRFKLFAQQYELIYIQGFSGWYTLQKEYKNRMFPPCILNFHGLEMYQQAASLKTWLEQIMFRPFVRKLLHTADYAQSLGGKLTEILIKNGIPSTKIIELGIGIESSWLARNQSVINSRRVFTFIGRFERRKGIKELTQVLKEQLPKFDFEFNFIGPISESKKIKSQHIIYHGLVKDQEYIKSILQKTDFLVAPSYAEGMPTVILEAMSSGCAVIASDVGAVSEQVSEKNGILITPGDTKSLYKALEKGIVMDALSLQKMKQYSVQLIKEKFIWEIVIKKMITTFHLVISNH